MNLLERIYQLHEPGADVWLWYFMLSLLTWYNPLGLLCLSTLSAFLWFQTAPAILKRETRKVFLPHFATLTLCATTSFIGNPLPLAPLILFSGLCVALTLLPEVVTGTAKLHTQLKEAK